MSAQERNSPAKPPTPPEAVERTAPPLGARVSPAVSGEGARGISRRGVIAEIWLGFGAAVAPLSNASGHPLVRTERLIIDPLVIRVAQRPHLAVSELDEESASELRARLTDAAADLAAAAAWYSRLKAARRRAGIDTGNPQDLYFQRCYGLARANGSPETSEDPDQIAADVVAEVGREPAASADRLRETVRDQRPELLDALRAAWAARGEEPAADPTPEIIAAALDAPTGSAEQTHAFEALITMRAGSSGGARLRIPGAARSLGLTAQERPGPPELGDPSSGREPARPFDRSILERALVALRPVIDSRPDADPSGVLEAEIARSAAAWQLGTEGSRVAMLLGADASLALGTEGGAEAGAAEDVTADGSDGAPDSAIDSTTDSTLEGTRTHTRLRDRWRREAEMRRANRLPARSGASANVSRDDDGSDAEALDRVRGAYLRRLWDELHERELRGGPSLLADALDAALRSLLLAERTRDARRVARPSDAGARAEGAGA